LTVLLKPIDHVRRYGVVVLVAAVDQVTKTFAHIYLFDPPVVVDIAPFLRFVPVWNSGVSFGLLGDSGVIIRVLLTIFALLVAIFLPFIARRWDRLSLFGGLLLAGGALGNAIDRITYGKVIDFIDVFAGQWHWPAFNVADMSISVGAGFLLFAALLEYRKGWNDSSNEGDEV
jgi:signal peptidase II